VVGQAQTARAHLVGEVVKEDGVSPTPAPDGQPSGGEVEVFVQESRNRGATENQAVGGVLEDHAFFRRARNRFRSTLRIRRPGLPWQALTASLTSWLVISRRRVTRVLYWPSGSPWSQVHLQPSTPPLFAVPCGLKLLRV